MAGIVGLGLALVGAEAGASVRDGTETPAPPPPPPASTLAGTVEVTVADSLSNADAIRGWIEERVASVLVELERAPELDEIIRVNVQGRAFAYEIAVVLVRNGHLLEGEYQPVPFTCECGSQELLERVGEAVTAGAKALGEAAEREREDAARAEEERRRQEELARQEAERAAAAQEKPRYRPSPLGRAGIGVLGVGGVITLSGIIMAAQAPQVVGGYGYVERDWSQPGYVVLGIGATAMAAGLTVLIVDVVRCRRDRARCGGPATTGSTPRAAWATVQHGGGG